MNNKEAKDQWKIEVNDRYHKVVDIIITLSTASLVLPIIFFREFLAIEQNENISNFINCNIWVSWVMLISAIALGCTFFYLSAKWVKQAYGQPTLLSETWLERLLNIIFWLMIGTFLFGLAAFIRFFLTFEVSG